MAKIPDNIVSIMMVDNAGAVVSVPVSDFISATTTTVVSAPVVIPSGKQPKAEVINTTIETSVAIEADPNYLVMPNSTQDNLINSVAYQNANKIGLNTKSPAYLLDVSGDSVNIKASSLPNGYRINSLLVASASSTLKTIYLGDITKLNIINLFSLIIAGLIPASPTTKTRILGIGDTGLVTTFTMPVTGSVLFSDGTTLASDPANFFWDDTNNRLGILTNTPAYSLDVNGTVRASTSLITPVIGNAAGITANNTWTFTSNVNVPLTPVNAAHAASKQYVDSTVYAMPTAGSVLFSDGTTIASDPAHFFWDDTNNRLGILTNTPAYSLDVNGTIRASTSLITPVIGNASGITANNTWTYTSNVNVPVTPVDAAHAASKQYVDSTVYAMPATGSVLFSNGTIIAADSAHFFWDDTNNRLGILTNTPTYSLDVNGTIRASTSLITPVIGNASGITANNNWTFTSNVNVPVTPVDATHAASKQYVDDTALTGLKLGASIKTVATSNVGLSGLSAINGYTPIAGDRILVIGQTTATENGVYDAASGGWTRSTDSDSDAELRGYQYLITAGTFINARYGNTNQSAITIGSTNITYQQISNAETDPIFTASPSFGITGTNITNWNTAYDRSAITLAVGGTTTKTITLTKQNGTTLTASFTDTVTSVFGRTGAVVLLSSDVTTALGFTPYNSSNPSGYTSNVGTVTNVAGTGTVSGLTLTGTVTTSGSLTLGGTLTLTSGNVTTALGFTPYNSTNPSGYTTNVGTVTSVAGTGTVSGLTLTGTVTTSGSLALGGTLTLTSLNVTNALTYTPYNGTDTSIRGLFSATAPLSYSSGVYSISQATTSSNGFLSSTNWNTFNSKENALTFSAPLVRTTNAISITQATTSTNGYLSSTDWTTFNIKQIRITLSTNNSSGAATFNADTGALNIPNYASGVTSILAGTGITLSPANGLGNVTVSLTGGGVPSLAQVCAVGSDATSAGTLTANITATAFFEYSDIRHKMVLGENPDVDLSSLDVIKYLRTTHDKDKIRYGYSAQDVYYLCPDLVNIDDSGYLSVNYTDTHTLLILSLQKRIAELERKLNAN